jgi:hypothetical protein
MLEKPPSLEDLERHYNEALLLDSKPEKGERKIADDFILLLNEISPKQTTQECLYLISLN